MIAKLLYRNLIPILLTIIGHLMLAVVFLIIQLKEMKPQHYENDIEVSFQEEAKPEEKNQQTIVDPTEKAIEKLERQVSGRATNIGVNASKSFKDEISTKKYIDELSKQYQIDSKLDKQDKIDDSNPSKDGTFQQKNTTTDKRNIVFKGKTNINYDLVNRHHTNLPVPVYKCEGSGRVTINIEVDQVGRVVAAKVDPSRSDANSCLVTEALAAAKRSLFNPDFKTSPIRQSGTISYTFVAQ